MTNTDYEYSYATPSRAKIQCNRNKYLNYVTVSFSCVECSEIELNGPKPVYISDDLTRNRAKLALCARELKRKKLIADIWVFDCSIFIKDNAGHIKKVTNQDDLRKYMPR